MPRPLGAWSSTSEFDYRGPEARQVVVRVDAVELIADGSHSTDIHVELFDRDGNRVETSTLAVAAEVGRVDLMTAEQGSYVLRYTAPSELDGARTEDTVTIADQGFTATATHMRGLTSPTGILELGYRVGRHRSAILVGLRSGYHRVAETVEVPPLGNWGASLDVVPVSLWAGYAWQLDRWSVTLAAGTSLGYTLGPGSLIVDVSGGGWTSSAESLVEGQPMLLTLGLGYRLRL